MMEVFVDIEQNSDAWREVRAGLVTASCFSQILAKGEGKTRAAYMRRLAAEIITGEPLENFSNQAMERGHALENEARNLYAFMHDVEPKQIGFIRNGRKGCSPDSLIDDNAMLEIKTQRGDLLIETILKGGFPSCHFAQVQGQLWVAEREWCDLLIYWPGLPPFIKRAYREEQYIDDLALAINQFNEDLDGLVGRIRAYGGLSEAKPSDLKAAANA
jgi:hypothetical protein